MTLDSFYFYGSIQQCWDMFLSEYERLKNVLDREPFIFEVPKHAAIHEYTPKDGDEIVIAFQHSNARHSLISVEAEPKAGDPDQLTIFVHAHENTFQEPGKSAIEIWKQVENAMRARGHLTAPAAPYKRKKHRAMQDKTRHALQRLREIRLDAIRNNRSIPKKRGGDAGSTNNKKTWREHDRALWAGWYDEDFRG